MAKTWDSVTWIVVSAAVSVVWGCPKDVRRQVRFCMEPLKLYWAEENDLFSSMSTMNKTTQLCTDGKIQEAFSCLNRLYYRCAKFQTGNSHFNILVEVGKWGQAMNNICSNMQYFQNNVDCETNVREEYEPCAKEEMKTFMKELSKMKSGGGVSTSANDKQKLNSAMNLGCNFTARILECLRKPFEKHCPQEISNLPTHILQDFVPPVCAKFMNTTKIVIYEFESSGSRGGSLSVHFRDRNEEPPENEASYEASRPRSKGNNGYRYSGSSSAQGGHSGSSRFQVNSVETVLSAMVFGLFLSKILSASPSP